MRAEGRSKALRGEFIEKKMIVNSTALFEVLILVVFSMLPFS